MKTNDIKFELTDNSSSNKTAILRITKPDEYAGIELSFGVITPVEDGDDFLLKFEFIVHHSPKHNSIQEAESDVQLQNVAGKILIELLDEYAKSESSKNNTQETNTK